MYISIDLETTGLDERICQIIEFGAVIDNGKTIDELPRFHCYIDHPIFFGEAYALSMHATIFRRIATKEKGYLYLPPAELPERFAAFCKENGLTDKIPVSGKNFGMFDSKFIRQSYPNWDDESVRFHHRVIDPGMLYYDPKIDTVPPDTKECLRRAGLPTDVAHTAIEDAISVIQLLRKKR